MLCKERNWLIPFLHFTLLVNTKRVFCFFKMEYIHLIKCLLNLEMKKAVIIIAIACVFSGSCWSQEKHATQLPYYQIPEAPEVYNAGTVISRMIDGLGFRYYWATEGLTDTDLNYKPSNEGRTANQTMEHLLGLSRVILNSAKKVPNDRTQPQKLNLGYAEKRHETLNNLKQASEIFRQVSDLSEFNIVFNGSNGSRKFPFWNNINGPIEDAIWHSGQIVMLRRSAGNPINPKVNVFLGKLND